MSIYNEDELIPPAWLHNKFLQKVLNYYERSEDVEIRSFDVSPASVKGDHYGSIMFRCKISYRCNKSEEFKQISLIIKTLPEVDCAKRDLLGNSGIFETEVSMYTETLPKIENILANCGEPTKIAAKLIYHSLDPHKVIVLEDLCVLGFDVLRGRHMTEGEVKMVLRKIAKLHAVTHMLGQSKDHEIVTKYQNGLFTNSIIKSLDLISSGIVYFIDMLAEREEFSVYLEKVKRMQPHMINDCVALHKAYELNKGRGDIFVLNHGDFHMKNLMFKFGDNNQTEDVVMVDYQISCYAPSSVDMIYSQFQMLSPELRLRRHEFMLYYFTEFIRVLRKIYFRGELPKYSDFQIACLKYRHYGLFLMSTYLPMFGDLMVSTENDLKEIDTSTYVENVDLLTLSYRRKNFIEDMRKFLPILLREGYLD